MTEKEAKGRKEAIERMSKGREKREETRKAYER